MSCTPFYVLFSILILAACSEGFNPEIRFLSRPDPYPEISDQQIINSSYGHARVPEGFYWERNEVTPYYINTVSIKSFGERDHIWTELCTDDFEQANAWSDSSNQNNSQPRELIRASENDKYFEFYRRGPYNSILYRVHKCSYFSHEGVDRFLPTPFLGTYKVEPVEAAGAGEAVEYLWFIRNFQFTSHSIIASDVTEMETFIQHEMIESIIGYGGSDYPDQITLRRLTTIVDKQSGEMTQQAEVLETLAAYGFSRVEWFFSRT